MQNVINFSITHGHYFNKFGITNQALAIKCAPRRKRRISRTWSNYIFTHRNQNIDTKSQKRQVFSFGPLHFFALHPLMQPKTPYRNLHSRKTLSNLSGSHRKYILR